MPLVLTSTFPLTLPIDGASVRLALKRLEPDEVTWLKAQIARMDADRGGPSDQTEAAYAADQVFVTRCLTDFVTVEPGELLFDGAEVRTGAQFLRIFAARTDLLARVVQAILVENACTAQQKQQLAAAQDGPRPAPLAAVAPRQKRAR